MGKRPYTKKAKKTPLDEVGLSLLGTALYLGQLNLHRDVRLGISRHNELQKQGLSVEKIERELDGEGLFCCDASFIPGITPEMRWAKKQVKALGCTRYSLEDAKAVMIHSVQFEWFHLYENRELALFLKDLGHNFTAQSYFSDYPIFQHEGDELSGLLWRLLFDELALFDEGHFTLHRPPRLVGEREYSFLVSDLCGAGISFGRRRGSGYNDDAGVAVNMALEVMVEKGVTAFQATHEIMVDFEIVPSIGGGIYRSGIMVSDGESSNGDEDGAFRRVYERVKKEAAKLKRHQLGPVDVHLNSIMVAASEMNAVKL